MHMLQMFKRKLIHSMNVYSRLSDSKRVNLPNTEVFGYSFDTS